MKLIIEKINDVTCVYRENEKHFASLMSERGLTKQNLPEKLKGSIQRIDNNCFEPHDNGILIFNLGPGTLVKLA